MRYRLFLTAGLTALLGAGLAAQSRRGPAGPPPKMEATVDGYHLAQTVPLPGAQGFWDYLGMDAPNHHLFVSHGNQVIVVSTDTNKVVGEISPTPSTHGAVVSERDNHGFTSNSGNSQGVQGKSSTTEFDAKTLKVIKEILLPISGSDGYVYDPATDRVFFLTHGKKDVAVNAKDGTVAGVVAIPGAAESAAADGRGHLYDVMEDRSTIVDINTRTLQVEHEWPLAPCKGPSGAAMDTHSRRIFIGCHGGGPGGFGAGVVFNPDTGKVVDVIALGGQGNDAARFDPSSKLAFFSMGEGDITILHEDAPNKYTLLGNVATQAQARTMEIDPTTHTLYSVTAKFEPPPPVAAGAPPPGRGRGRGRFRSQMVPGSFTLLIIPRS
ncbi:MAG: YncE family protein [Terriglobales bacterium]